MRSHRPRRKKQRDEKYNPGQAVTLNQIMKDRQIVNSQSDPAADGP